MGACILGAGLVASYAAGPGLVPTLAFVCGVITLILGATVIKALQRRLQSDAYLSILPLLLPSVDKWSIGVRQAAPEIARMPGHYFAPRNKIDCDFHIALRCNGFRYSVTEAEFSRDSAEHSDVTFRGTVVSAVLDRQYPGDFAALRRPERPRSVFRGTRLPDRLMLIPNGTRLGSWAYDFVSTDLPTAQARLTAMVTALEGFMALEHDDLPQIAVRHSDGYVLLPFTRSNLRLPPVPQAIDVDRHLKPLAHRLMQISAAAQAVRSI